MIDRFVLPFAALAAAALLFPPATAAQPQRLDALAERGLAPVTGAALRALYSGKTHYGVDDQGREAVIYYSPGGERRLRALGRRFTTQWWMNAKGLHCVDAVVGGTDCGLLVRIDGRWRHCTADGRCRYWVRIAEGNPENL